MSPVCRLSAAEWDENHPQDLSPRVRLEVFQEGCKVWLAVVLQAVPDWVVDPSSPVLVAQRHLESLKPRI